ncbi:hypothetical protein COCNU_scaffold001196G000020 [Cocos nucifera]|nr:hypothetical protein [Cocos nucifera]
MKLSRRLEICEQKRRSLQDQLSELERCWKPLIILFELREINNTAAIVESLRRNNENKGIDLQVTENKVKRLSETKKSLSMQLSGQRYCEGADMQASTSAAKVRKVLH